MSVCGGAAVVEKGVLLLCSGTAIMQPHAQGVLI
jgi:hypothetical protein